MQRSLISLTDKVFPSVNELFSRPDGTEGHQKWVDLYHLLAECISRVSEKAFAERYQKWCKRQGYSFSAAKASDIYTEKETPKTDTGGKVHQESE